MGFHINALYSPWRENWHALAQDWHAANKEGNPEKLKAFINLRLGETWEEQGDSIEAVFGDPGQEHVWNELDSFLLSTWEHASGQKVKITCTMIDSGGLHTDSVYRFVRARQHRKIFALKGSSESGKEILGKFSVNNQYRVKLWLIGTDTAKDRIFARMKIPGPGPGYMHLPDFAEDEYLAQLTSEKAVRRYRRGKGTVREYLKTRARNEALDLEVYALAALYVLGQAAIRKLGELAAALRVPPTDPPVGGSGGQQGGSGGSPGRPGGGSSWVQGWR